MSLLAKLKKNSTIKESNILTESIYLHEKDMIPTPVPMLNVALSGTLDGGMTSGTTIWAGPSRHMKSLYCLLMTKTYMDKYPDAILMFYDNEFGSPLKYFESLNIDMTRVVHNPFTDIEQLKMDVVTQLTNIERGDKVFFMIDSIGNAASKREIDDTLEGKSAADFTRSKSLKSFFRMVTPHLILKDVMLHAVAHTYKEIGMYPKDIISGGTSMIYNPDTVFIIGRQQEKDGKEIAGYNFIINVEKSRYVKEKSKIPITVTYEKGIEKYSGLMDIALEGGFVFKPSNGWYCKVDRVTGEEMPKKRLAETMNGDFWDSILADKEFQEYVKKKYQVSYGNLINDGEGDSDEV